MNKALKAVLMVPLIAVGVVALIAGSFAFIGSSFDFSPAPAQPAPKADPAKEARFQLAVAALMAIKKSAKDPDSVKFEEVLVDDAGKLACVTYRAKNSFNATVPGHSVFAENRAYHNDAKAWSKHCANKTLNDVKYARQAV